MRVLEYVNGLGYIIEWPGSGDNDPAVEHLLVIIIILVYIGTVAPITAFLSKVERGVPSESKTRLIDELQGLIRASRMKERKTQSIPKRCYCRILPLDRELKLIRLHRTSKFCKFPLNLNPE